MHDNTEIFKILMENWEVAFLYIFKYLSDISKTIKKLEIDISVLKYANEISNKGSKVNSLSKKLFFYMLAAAAGLAIAIFFDWMDGGLQFTLN